jgi:hypothetical protein
VGAVPGPASLPGEKLQAIWRWNLNRNRRQEELGKDIFVPKISPLFQAGTILTTAVWTDAIPIELPEVDVVLIVLDEYKGMFERTGSVRSMPFDELRPSLDEFTGSHEPVKHWHLGYTRPPKALIRLVRKARKVSGRFAMVSWDRVLDAELLAKAHNKT